VDVNFSRLGRPEMAGMASGILLDLSLFLPWFTTEGSNPHSTIQGTHGGPGGGVFNAFQSYDYLQWALILMSLAPFVHAWIAVRGHEVGWLRGELTAIIGFLCLILVLMNTIILGQPGTVQVYPSWGIVVALLASVGILLSGSIRQYSFQEPEPPGI
jgi:hypothetical protein